MSTQEKFSQERLMQIITRPMISEKSTFIGDKHNQVALEVVPDATKPEIKAAVELMFKGAKVTAVRVINVLGKNKKMGRSAGKRRDWKKAYVSLESGSEINFAGGE
jgi:large subunit ribosomal protein L23